MVFEKRPSAGLIPGKKSLKLFLRLWFSLRKVMRATRQGPKLVKHLRAFGAMGVLLLGAGLFSTKGLHARPVGDFDDLYEHDRTFYGSEKEEKFPVSALFVEKEKWAEHESLHVFWLYGWKNYPRYKSSWFLPFYYHVESKMDDRARTLVPPFYYHRKDASDVLTITPVYYHHSTADAEFNLYFWLVMRYKTEHSSHSALFPFFYRGEDRKTNESYTAIFPLFIYRSSPDARRVNVLGLADMAFDEEGVRRFWMLPLFFYGREDSSDNRTRESHLAFVPLFVRFWTRRDNLLIQDARFAWIYAELKESENRGAGSTSTQGYFLNYFWSIEEGEFNEWRRRDASRILFPLVYVHTVESVHSSTQKRYDELTFINPLFGWHTSDQSGSESYAVWFPGIPLVYFRRAATSAGSDTLSWSPVHYVHSTPTAETVWVLPYYHRHNASGGHVRIFFPIYYSWWSETGADESRITSSSTLVPPLFYYGRDEGKGDRSTTLWTPAFGFHSETRSDATTKFSFYFPGIPLFYWSSRNTAAGPEKLSVSPIHYYESAPGSSFFWFLLYVHRESPGWEQWHFLPFAHAWERRSLNREGTTSTGNILVLPLFFFSREEMTRRDDGAIGVTSTLVTPIFGSRTRDGTAGDGFSFWLPGFPLIYAGVDKLPGGGREILSWSPIHYIHSTPTQENVWFLPYYHSHNDEEGRHLRVIFPLYFAWWGESRDARYDRTVAPPFVYLSSSSSKTADGSTSNFALATILFGYTSGEVVRNGDKTTQSAFWFPIVPIFYTESESGPRGDSLFSASLIHRYEKTPDFESLLFLLYYHKHDLVSGANVRALFPLYFSWWGETKNARYDTTVAPPFMYMSSSTIKSSGGSVSSYFFGTLFFGYSSREETRGAQRTTESAFWFPIIPIFYAESESGPRGERSFSASLIHRYEKDPEYESLFFLLYYHKHDKRHPGATVHSRHLIPVYFSFWTEDEGPRKRESNSWIIPFVALMETNSTRDQAGTKIADALWLVTPLFGVTNRQNTERKTSSWSFWFPIIPIFYAGYWDDGKETEGMSWSPLHYYHRTGDAKTVWSLLYYNGRTAKGTTETTLLFPVFYSYATDPAGSGTATSSTYTLLSAYRTTQTRTERGEADGASSTQFWAPIFLPLVYYSSERGSAGTESVLSFSPFHYYSKTEGGNKHLWALLYYSSWYPHQKELVRHIFPLYYSWSKYDKEDKAVEEGEIFLPFYVSYEDKNRYFHANLSGISVLKSKGTGVDASLSFERKDDETTFDWEVSWLYNAFSISSRITVPDPTAPKRPAEKKTGTPEKAALKKKPGVSREDSRNFFGISFLYGVFAYERADSKRHIRLLPLTWFTWDSNSDDAVYFIPPVFYSHSENVEYLVVFPFYAKQAEGKSFFQAFGLFVFQRGFDEADNRWTYSILWPLVRFYFSPEEDGGRVFPFAWWEKDKRNDMISGYFMMPLFGLLTYNYDYAADGSRGRVESYSIFNYYEHKWSQNKEESSLRIPFIPIYMQSYERNKDESTFWSWLIPFYYYESETAHRGKENLLTTERSLFLLPALGVYSSSTPEEGPAAGKTFRRFVSLFGFYSTDPVAEETTVFAPILPLVYHNRTKDGSHTNVLWLIDVETKAGALERVWTLPVFMWKKNDYMWAFPVYYGEEGNDYSLHVLPAFFSWREGEKFTWLFLPFLTYYRSEPGTVGGSERRTAARNQSRTDGPGVGPAARAGGEGTGGFADAVRSTPGEREVTLTSIGGYYHYEPDLKETTWFAPIIPLVYHNRTAEGSHTNVFWLIDFETKAGSLDRFWFLPVFLWKKNDYTWAFPVYYGEEGNNSSFHVLPLFFSWHESGETTWFFLPTFAYYHSEPVVVPPGKAKGSASAGADASAAGIPNVEYKVFSASPFHYYNKRPDLQETTWFAPIIPLVYHNTTAEGSHTNIFWFIDFETKAGSLDRFWFLPVFFWKKNDYLLAGLVYSGKDGADSSFHVLPVYYSWDEGEKFTMFILPLFTYYHDEPVTLRKKTAADNSEAGGPTDTIPGTGITKEGPTAIRRTLVSPFLYVSSRPDLKETTWFAPLLPLIYYNSTANTSHTNIFWLFDIRTRDGSLERLWAPLGLVMYKKNDYLWAFPVYAGQNGNNSSLHVMPFFFSWSEGERYSWFMPILLSYYHSEPVVPKKPAAKGTAASGTESSAGSGVTSPEAGEEIGIRRNLVSPLLYLSSRPDLKETTWFAPLIPLIYYNSTATGTHTNFLWLFDVQTRNGSLERLWLPLGLFMYKKNDYLWILPFYHANNGTERSVHVAPLFWSWWRDDGYSIFVLPGLYLHSSPGYSRQNFLFLFDHERRPDYSKLNLLFGIVQYESTPEVSRMSVLFRILGGYEYRAPNQYNFNVLWYIQKRDGDRFHSSFLPLYWYSSSPGHTTLTLPLLLSYFDYEGANKFELVGLGLIWYRNYDAYKRTNTEHALLGTVYIGTDKPERGYRSRGSLWGFLWEKETEDETNYRKFSILKGAVYSRTTTAKGETYSRIFGVRINHDSDAQETPAPRSEERGDNTGGRPGDEAESILQSSYEPGGRRAEASIAGL